LPSLLPQVWLRSGSGELERDERTSNRCKPLRNHSARGAFLSVPGQKDKFTPELRIIVASLLSMVVILLWAKFFGPKPPVQVPQADRLAQSAPAPPGPLTPCSASSSQAPAAPAAQAAAAPVTVTPRIDTQERTITIENNLYQVEISNQGAVVRSW